MEKVSPQNFTTNTNLLMKKVVNKATMTLSMNRNSFWKLAASVSIPENCLSYLIKN